MNKSLVVLGVLLGIMFLYGCQTEPVQSCNESDAGFNNSGGLNYSAKGTNVYLNMTNGTETWVDQCQIGKPKGLWEGLCWWNSTGNDTHLQFSVLNITCQNNCTNGICL